MTEADAKRIASTTPWMVRPACIDRCGSVREFQRIMARRWFGELARLESVPGDLVRRIATIEERMKGREELLAAWRRHLAREILVALRLCRPWAADMADRMAGWPVYRECGLHLGDFLDCDLAVAAFPYAEGDHGHPCFLWVFESRAGLSNFGADHRGWLQIKSPWLDELERRLIFVVEPGAPPHNTRIFGDSWQLAFALALRSLAAPESTQAFAALVGDWIASGSVNANGRISRVGKVVEKLNADTDRAWLLPAENRSEVPAYSAAGKPLPPAWFASDMDSAWAHVTGDGVVEGGETAWPERVDVMHSFVSGAWMPVVACALLCRPKRVVLWHSDNEKVSKNPARQIRKLLEQKLFAGEDGFSVDLRCISSRSLAEAERTLAGDLRKDLAQGGNVIFNVTQGNRVMSYAPLELSRLYPNLFLVYRDLDAEEGVFTLIRYEGNRPTTLVIAKPEPKPRDDIEWGPLFTKPRDPQQTPAETMWEILRRKPDPPPSSDKP